MRVSVTSAKKSIFHCMLTFLLTYNGSYAAESKWEFSAASGDEVNELGNCTLALDRRGFIFFANGSPKEEVILAFISHDQQGPVNWDFGTWNYVAREGAAEFFDSHSEIRDSNFVSELMRAKSVTATFNGSRRTTLNLTGIVEPGRQFISCMDQARRSATNPSSGVQDAKSSKRCTWDDGIYMAKDSREPAVSYTVEFEGGATSGSLIFSKQKDDRVLWRNTSSFGCSNGTSICSVDFALASGEKETIVFDSITTSSGDVALVFSGASQMIYNHHSGLATKPSLGKDQQNAIPRNVYELTDCKKQ